TPRHSRRRKRYRRGPPERGPAPCSDADPRATRATGTRTPLLRAAPAWLSPARTASTSGPEARAGPPPPRGPHTTQPWTSAASWSPRDQRPPAEGSDPAELVSAAQQTRAA